MPFQMVGYIPSVKPGVYQAVLLEVEEKAAKKDPTNVFRVWHFQLTDGSLRMIDGSSSLYTSDKSKGGKWLRALLGKVPADGEIAAPEGKTCTVQVDLDDNGYERVVDVLPPISGAQNAAQQHAIQEGDDLPF